MTDIAIRVQNLGKQYHIGALQKNGGAYTYKSLRDTLANAAALPLRAARALVTRNGRRPERKDDTIWALKDVSFEVKRGEIVGVIGRNGAGKSTLLKLLSRITEPTTGRAFIHGRVGSLLEVGTGFHPELTGRDNVYLNGAILGMKRAEIARQFDEIVAFAEIEKFLDTPVKHYSSGMYLRLAFAVAAHLQTEILLVDEVLAVGDQRFQEKCLGKMQDVSAREGRTVILVSHNLSAVKTLCTSGILLDCGELLYRGTAHGALERYLSSSVNASGQWFRKRGKGNEDEMCFDSVSLLDDAGNVRTDFDFNDTIHVKIRAFLARRFANAQVAMCVTCNTDERNQFIPLEAGPLTYSVQFPPHLLSPGRYFLRMALHIPRIHLYDLIDNELSFIVHETGSPEQLFQDGRLGVVNAPVRWQAV